jgi:hypothetical protein
MGRIEPVGSARTGRVEAIRPAADAGTAQTPSRALVVVDGGRRSEPRSAASFRDGRAEAGFVAQLLVDADPTLRTSRLTRSRLAAERYTEMARLVG